MTRKQWAPIAGLAAAAVLVTGGIAVTAVHPWTTTADDEQAAGQPSSTTTTKAVPDGTRSAAALREDFLDDYVRGGRVVRTDQGGDTVSEGQAYGMLIALASDDRSTFADIWKWTRQHLQGDDHLLAWRWQERGGTADEQSASDADLDAARALVLAGERFDEPSYTAAGKQMGRAILDRETVQTDVGRILLPGPWAKTADPYKYDVSYASPVAYAVLSSATGDPRWRELETGSRVVAQNILAETDLPSDWAQVHQDGTVDPLPSASGESGPVVYGWDAMRMPLRYAESCSADDRVLAGSIAPTLRRTTQLAAQLDLGGTAVTDSTSALAYAARAASEQATGSTAAATADLVRADRTSASTPTYYGDAWAALGATMLTSDVLGGCAADGGSSS
ncbi:glycosyl hydrolase family 8 [Curtobacterium sp. RRHDQ10]|uniref:glycosyl hydrolase family 8 n=1 Tax=Curtobacterium phyllosphaerae TaxID=3413379 RepID=UPI003BF21CD5